MGLCTLVALEPNEVARSSLSIYKRRKVRSNFAHRHPRTERCRHGERLEVEIEDLPAEPQADVVAPRPDLDDAAAVVLEQPEMRPARALDDGDDLLRRVVFFFGHEEGAPATLPRADPACHPEAVEAPTVAAFQHGVERKPCHVARRAQLGVPEVAADLHEGPRHGVVPRGENVARVAVAERRA